MKNRAVIILLILTLSIFLAACTAISSGSGSTNLNVTMSEFKFTPNTWTVSAGESVSISLTNNGTLTHTWTIMSKPITGSYTSANQADIYYTSPVVSPGSSQTVDFTAPSTPGTYQVICTQSGHFEGGMVGELTVK